MRTDFISKDDANYNDAPAKWLTRQQVESAHPPQDRCHCGACFAGKLAQTNDVLAGRRKLDIEIVAPSLRPPRVQGIDRGGHAGPLGDFR